MQDKQTQPWWTFGHVWLVIAGPAIVVVASFVTLYLAITIPDPVIDTQVQRQTDPAAQPGTTGSSSSLAPAMQARNHAATSVPKPSRP
ncbi:MAG: nitrogen fixation protein FixH [Polaromonas sp.]